MTLFVDTSVWSLALRRDAAPPLPAVQALASALSSGAEVVTTGLVLQELLQGFAGPKAAAQIIQRFGALPMVQPDRDDHIEAAAVRNACRRAGVQIGTVDALLARLCIRHDLTMLSTDLDFEHVARHQPLRLWPAGRPALR
ncbi:MAG: PIN domain-containing protein [Rubrivivax sp.]